MTSNTRRVRIALLLTFLPVFFGCSSQAIIDSNGDQFQDGVLFTIEDRQLNEVYAAVKQVQFELNLKEMNNSKDGMSAMFVMSSARNRTIFMELESISVDRTQINLRYGFLGDHERSRRLMSEIRDRYDDPDA